MGNKESQFEKRNLSLIKSSHEYMNAGSFGIKGSWKPIAILAVLDILYQTPWLLENILRTDIDTTCQRADRTAILELQLLFDARSKATLKTVQAVEQFALALTASQLEGDTNDFEQDDPAQVFEAISSLIITTLPSLKSFFLRDKLVKEVAPSCKDPAGICLSIPHKPDSAVHLDTLIFDKFFSKATNLQPAPVFVITTAFTAPLGLLSTSLTFSQNITTKISDGTTISYDLQAIIVQSIADPINVKSYYVSTQTSTWCESGSSNANISSRDIFSLGNSDSRYRPRVFVYVQTKVIKLSEPACIRKDLDSRGKEHAMIEDPDIMNEDTGSDNDIGIDDPGDFMGDEGDFDDDLENDDEIDYEDSRCQCKNCLAEFGRKESSKSKLEEFTRKSREKLKLQLIRTTPGTKIVPFCKTIDRKEKMVVGNSAKFLYFQSITAMEGYKLKSFEELRFEDYCNDNPALKDIKDQLDREKYDRVKEKTNLLNMEREERLTRIWEKAAAKAWGLFEDAIAEFRSNITSRSIVVRKFSDTLDTCLTGPHTIDCYYYRALCYIDLKNIPLAIDDLESILNLSPRHVNSNFLLGSILLSNHIELEKAEQYLKRAFCQDRSFFLHDISRLYVLVRAEFMAAQQRKINQAEALKTEGNKALQKGDHVTAIRCYTEAIELSKYGDNSHIYYSNRAAARSELGMKQENNPIIGCQFLLPAINDCDQSLALQPGYPKALFRKSLCFGILHFYREEFDKALIHLSAALELDPMSSLVKQEIRKVNCAIDVIKAREKAQELEKEHAAREAQRALERENERRVLQEKKLREEQLRKEKAEKLEKEKAERLRIKLEKEQAKVEREKALAEEKLKEKERLRVEKEKEKALKEQFKNEERERKRIEKEKEKERLKVEKQEKEKELEIERERERERAKEKEIELEREREREREKKAALEHKDAHLSSSDSQDAPISNQAQSTKPRVSSTIGSIAMIAKSIAKSNGITAKSTASGHSTATSSTLHLPSAGSPNTSNNVIVQESTHDASLIATGSTAASLTNNSSSLGVGVAGNGVSHNPTHAQAQTAASTATPILVQLSSHSSQPQPIISRHMDCPQSKVGMVIGAKGTIINEMMKRTGCKMCINQEFPDGQPRKVILTGTQDQIEDARVLVAAVIIHGPNVLNSPETISEVSVSIKNGSINLYSGLGALDQPLDGSHHISGGSLEDPSFGSGCLTCSDATKRLERRPVIGHCNHKHACSICIFKRRSIEEDFSCPVCRSHLDEVYCLESEINQEAGAGTGAGKVDFDKIKSDSDRFQFHIQSKMYFPREYFRNVVSLLTLSTCPKCFENLGTLDNLKSHYLSHHNQIVCNFCLRGKTVFSLEHRLFSPKEYEVHIAEAKSDGTELHPICVFCKDRYCDKADLGVHISKEHEFCQICQKDGKYFKNFQMLSEHLHRDHFACDEGGCFAKGNVAFRSLFELQAHKRTYHSQASSFSVNGQRQDSNLKPAVFSLGVPPISEEQSGSQGDLGDDLLDFTKNLDYIIGDSSDDPLSGFTSARGPSLLESTTGATFRTLPLDASAQMPSNSAISYRFDTAGVSPWQHESLFHESSIKSNHEQSASIGESLFSIFKPPSSLHAELSGDQEFKTNASSGTNIPFSSSLPTQPAIIPPTSSSTSTSTSTSLFAAPGFDSGLSHLGRSELRAPVILGLPVTDSSVDGGRSSLFPNSVVSTQSSSLPTSAPTAIGSAVAQPVVSPWMSSPGFSLFNSPAHESHEFVDMSFLGFGGIIADHDKGLVNDMPPLARGSSLGSNFSDRDIFSQINSSSSSSLFGLLAERPSSSTPPSQVPESVHNIPPSLSRGSTGSYSSLLGSPIHGNSFPSVIGQNTNSTLPGFVSSPSMNDRKIIDSDLSSPSIFGVASDFQLRTVNELPPEFIPNSKKFPVSTSGTASTAISSSTTIFGTSTSSASSSASVSASASASTSASAPSSAPVSVSAPVSAPASSPSSSASVLSGMSLASALNNPTPFGLNLMTLPNDGAAATSSSTLLNSYPSANSLTSALGSDDRLINHDEILSKMIQVLKVHPEGILGSQFKEEYQKFHNEKLVLESVKGKKLKLLNVLSGVPNVRKEQAGTWRWFYDEKGEGSSSSNRIGASSSAFGTSFPFGNSSDEQSILLCGEEYEVIDLPSSLSVLSWTLDYELVFLQSSSFPNHFALHLPPELTERIEREGILDSLFEMYQIRLSLVNEKINRRMEGFLLISDDDCGFNFTQTLSELSEVIQRFLTEVQSDIPLPIDEDSKIVMDIPQASVGLIAGKEGRKLYNLRKRSGAAISLVSKVKSNQPAKLTISGAKDKVEVAQQLVNQILCAKDK